MNLLPQSGRWAGVMIKRSPDLGLKKEEESFLMKSILVLVAEWISSKDTAKLYELSSTLYVVLQESLGKEIMESLGDHTWILSEEWPNLCLVKETAQA